MKKYSILFLVIFFSITFTSTGVFAQSPSDLSISPSQISKENDQLTVSLEDLGNLDRILYSPYDSMRTSFNIPPEWSFKAGSKFFLNYEVLLGGADLAQVPNNLGSFVGVLSVVFNDQVIEEVYVNSSGENNLEINIPTPALVSPRSNGRHELALIFNGSLSCEYDIRTTLVIKASSFFALPFETVPPELDLSNLPAPFFVRNNVYPTTTLFVLPSNPSPSEMEAAFNIIGGFGSLTGSEFVFDTLPENQLTEELISESNLIFVGMPESFDLLSSIQFPLDVENGQFSNPSFNLSDEGVIQLALSPWNPNKVVLLVSGNSEVAVNKAAKAVSAGNIFVSDSPALAFVADVQTEVDQIPVVENFRLKDLGYSTVSLGTGGFGFGSTSSSDTSYSFFIPKEQVSSEEAWIDLLYYSGRLVVGESSMTVTLNDEKIAAILLNEDTSGSLRKFRVDIPPGLLRFGENRLEFLVDLIPIYSCDTLGFPDYFIAIHENTQLNIPVNTIQDQVAEPLDFRLYPGNFIDSSDLNNIAFVISSGDPVGWNVAAKIAFSFGRLANPLISNMSLAYSDSVPTEIRDGKDLIIVGRSSRSPFLVEINGALPAPFDVETDTANEKGLQVTYVTPPDVNLGYLELLNSPFNLENEVLVVSGNSDDGLNLAGIAITERASRRELMGLFAITNGNQIATSRVVTPYGFPENQSSIASTLAPDGETIVTTPIPSLPLNPQTSWSQPNWLVPVLIVVALLVILIIIRQFIITRNTQ